MEQSIELCLKSINLQTLREIYKQIQGISATALPREELNQFIQKRIESYGTHEICTFLTKETANSISNIFKTESSSIDTTNLTVSKLETLIGSIGISQFLSKFVLKFFYKLMVILIIFF